MKKNLKTICFSLALVILFIFNVIYLERIYNKLEYIETNYNENTATNAPKRLLLQGAYGDNQSYHPKVLNFKKEWNGYKYWISFTPYPFADSSKENPHVKASNDMIHWVAIGKNEPLDEVTNPDNNTRYNSDSHLVYNNDTNELECWWRYVDDATGEVIIFRRKSKDGRKWTKKEEIFRAQRAETDWISPAIIYEDNVYKIWYVNKNKIYYLQTSDFKKLPEPRLLNIEYEDDVKSWHLDVIHTPKGYEMIIVAYTDWAHRALMNLYYTKSKDNSDYDIAQVILKPTTRTSHWDNSGLYRSSFIYEDDTYYVFYSGQGTDNAKGIGLMYGKDIFDLHPMSY